MIISDVEKMSFGRYIALRRKALNKTQKELADAFHYTPQAISKLEVSGGSLSCTLLPTLCAFLLCDVDDLYIRDPDAPQKKEREELISDDEIGKSLERLREESRLSQEDFASKVGIAPKSLRSYEKSLQIPPFSVIEQYCDFLHILPSKILSRAYFIAPSPKLKSRRKPILIGALSAAMVAVIATGVTLGVVLGTRDRRPPGLNNDSSSSSISSEPPISTNNQQPSSSPSSISEPSSTPSSFEESHISSEEELSSVSSEEPSSIFSSEESSSEEISSQEQSFAETSSEESSFSEESSEESPESSAAEQVIPIAVPRTTPDNRPELTSIANESSFFMGSYPQSAVTDANLIDSLSALPHGLEDGAILTLGEDKYLARETRVTVKTDLDETLVVGFHYFHFDPIEWKPLVYDGEGYLFIAKNSLIYEPFTDPLPLRDLGAGAYEEWGNNYEYSSARTYLNSVFYNEAFSATDKEKILLARVDNSLCTDNSLGNGTQNLCNDTEDYVFLPSIHELAVAYDVNKNKVGGSSDLFRALGGSYDTDVATPNAAHYWLRTPYDAANMHNYVHCIGSFGTTYVTFDLDDVSLNRDFWSEPDAADYPTKYRPYGLRPVIKMANLPS